MAIALALRLCLHAPQRQRLCLRASGATSKATERLKLPQVLPQHAVHERAEGATTGWRTQRQSGMAPALRAQVTCFTPQGSAKPTTHSAKGSQLGMAKTSFCEQS